MGYSTLTKPLLFRSEKGHNMSVATLTGFYTRAKGEERKYITSLRQLKRGEVVLVTLTPSKDGQTMKIEPTRPGTWLVSVDGGPWETIAKYRVVQHKPFRVKEMAKPNHTAFSFLWSEASS
jgi:hypothetical protein